MELDDDTTKVVHRARAEGGANYWVIGLIALLWIMPAALWIPEMP